MRVRSILRRLLGSRCDSIHAARLAVVHVVVEAMARLGRLSVTAVGRGMCGPVAPKHNIKRVDRLLSNRHLAREVPTFYGAVAATLLRGVPRPVVLIDWTQLTETVYALVAAVPIEGRAIPLYIEAHPIERNNSPAVEKAFLRALRGLLPRNARPIVVCDAGFRRPFYEAVLELGWDFVGRVRGRVLARRGERAFAPPELVAGASRRARDLGDFELATWREHQAAGCLLLFRLVTVHRRGRRRAHTGNPTAWNKKKAARSAREPWLLATSLRDLAAKRVVSLYATRMSIEQTFRDAKNHRWGWALCDVRSASPRRLNVLMLLATLALVVVGLLGLSSARTGVDRKLQGNTTAHRAISIFVLGGMVLRMGRGPSTVRLALDEVAALRNHWRLDVR